MWKCLVACRFGELSQQPTCPHVRTGADAPTSKRFSGTPRSRARWASPCGFPSCERIRQPSHPPVISGDGDSLAGVGNEWLHLRHQSSIDLHRLERGKHLRVSRRPKPLGQHSWVTAEELAQDIPRLRVSIAIPRDGDCAIRTRCCFADDVLGRIQRGRTRPSSGQSPAGDVWRPCQTLGRATRSRR